ncbi:MAG: hypothetical protein MUF53_11395 [Gemmatimonadaceae bacterium]|jgi:hypothetical protein|nr:hypothetical protein [Gemmatimonadaceae bacterium]
MTAARRGVLLPIVLLALLALGTAAVGAAWGAQAVARAEQSALVTDARWRQADRLLSQVPCEMAAAGESRTYRFVTPSGEATVRVHYATGACWASVAVGDTIPLVGGFLTAQESGVTQEANTTPVVLPSIEAVAELATRSPAPSPEPTWGRRPPTASGLVWRDLR